MAKITSSRRRANRTSVRTKVTQSGGGNPGSARITPGRGGKPSHPNAKGSNKVTSSADRTVRQGSGGQRRLTGKPQTQTQRLTGTKTKASLPAKGQSGGNKPPKGTKAPSDGRRPETRRQQATNRQQQAARGTKGNKVQTPKPPKQPNAYKQDIKSLAELGKRALSTLLKPRSGAQGVGAYLAAKMWESKGKPGAANMSLLGGDAPVSKKKGKKK
jgi:hypothetical protein